MIIDCCTYFAERDILELRLRELDPVVDLFVVVEAFSTHQGAPRVPVLERAAWLDPWRHKIVTHAARLPEGEGAHWTWRREIAQRNAIADVLGRLRLAPDDMVLISDCDEIPRRQFVASLAGLPADGVAVALQRLSYYTFNHLSDALWRGTRATQWANVQALGPDGVRYVGVERGGYPRIFHVPDAGWHLSYFGGAEAVRNKITSFLHEEFNLPEHRDPDTIAARIASGADVYGRPEQAFTIAPPPDLPAAVTERPSRWLDHFHPDHRPAFAEDWMSDDQCTLLARLAMAAPAGAAVEIGAWEGKSTVAIAGVRALEVVDTWRGNEAEGDDHPSVVAARERDVYAQFAHNLRAYGVIHDPRRVVIHRADWREGVERVQGPLAFVHLDAAHDEESVRDQIAAILPRLVPGAVVCGDDAFAPGVEAAVMALLPDAQTNGKLWWWRKTDAHQ